MSSLSPPTTPLAHHDPAHRPRVTLVLLRIITALLTLAVLAQPVLAGSFMSGNRGAVEWHEIMAHVIQGLSVVLLGVAVSYRFLGGGTAWPMVAAFALLALVTGQVTTGFELDFAWHIPLGVALAIVSVVMSLWVFSPYVARPRRNALKPRSEEAV